MGKSGQIHGQYFRNFGKISEASADRIRAFMRRRFPDRTAEHVAADLGASVDTARKWLDGTCAPSLVWFSRMLSAWGPEFLAAAMIEPQAWLVSAAKAAARARIDAEHAAQLAALERAP